ncbi:hypothetical protein B0H10DRAFT_408277 [Mycena sp. CBHHK59/15]|nr:hypothetical protein B0H10DRAFT_408277 [Mycena sp. CBHHK59/15]
MELAYIPTRRSSPSPPSTMNIQTKFKTPTCVLCRQRKLRCDGGNPCRPCSRARKLVVCTYVPRAKGQLRSELPKGGACVLCRQRKRRCDGNFPCQTCIGLSRPDHCQYREKPPCSRPWSTTPRTDTRHDRHDGASASPSRSCASASSSRSSTSSPLEPNLPELSYPQPEPAVPQPEYAQMNSLLDLFLPWPESIIPGCACPASSGDNCAPSEKSIVLPILPPVSESRPAYPALPKNVDSSNSDVSTTRTTFLDSLSPMVDPLCAATTLPPDRAAELFRIRKVFVDHGWQYGLNVLPEKREAMLRGCISGLFVDPILVTICQLMGYHLAAHSHPEAWIHFAGQTEAEAQEGVTVLNLLEGRPDGVSEPVTRLQVYTFLAVYCAQKGDIFSFHEFIRKAGDAAAQNYVALGLDDVSASDRRPGSRPLSFFPRSTAQEARAAFSHLIYVDLGSRVILKLPSLIDPGLLPNFRRLASVHSPHTELNFIRAKSAVFLTDSLQLADEFGLDAPRDWSTRYWTLIEDIYAHLNVINTPAMEALIPELEIIQPTLRTCIIMALTALAKLYGLFAHFQPESRRKCREVVEEIARVSSLFQSEDYQYLDPTLGVCWSIASRQIMEAEPVNGLPEWDPASVNSLRECRKKLSRAIPFVNDV